MKLATIQETADRLRVSPRTVERMLTRGEIAGYQFPTGTIRIDQQEIDQFLQKCCTDKQTQETDQ